MGALWYIPIHIYEELALYYLENSHSHSSNKISNPMVQELGQLDKAFVHGGFLHKRWVITHSGIYCILCSVP